MKHIFTILMVSILLASNAFAAEIKRPTTANNPVWYLEEFPLGVVTQEEMIDAFGIPDKTATLGDKTYASYNIDNDGSGIIEYTYILKDEKIVDVKYLNSGNFFGIEQRETASELQKKKEK